MKGRNFGMAAGFVFVGLMAGSVFGPPIVSAGQNSPAAVSDVHIRDRDSSTLASVDDNHRLQVNTEADRTDLGGDDYLNTFGLQYILPNGQDVLANGSGGCSKSTSNGTVIANVNVNLSGESAGITTITVKDKSNSNIVWQTSYDNLEMGSRDITFDGGVYLPGGYTVTATGTTGGLVCQVIGQDLGAAGGPSLHAAGK